jgi:hypothetical protein
MYVYILIWLNDWLLTAQEYLTYILRRHLCRWRAAKFTPMLMAFEQGGIFVVPRLLWHGTVFTVSPDGLSTHDEIWRIYSNPDPQRG